MDDPTLVLTPPVATDPAHGGIDFLSPAKVLSYLSPSKWLLELIKELTGVDVLSELISPFVGHWDRVSAYGDALGKISQCLQGVSANVSSVGDSLDVRWDGNAADAAHAYFGSVGSTLRQQSDAFVEAGERYQQLAVGMWHHRMAAGHLLTDVLDTALEISIWAAIGAATAETGVGPVVALAMALHRTYKLIHALDKWKDLVSLAVTTVEGTGAVLYSLTRMIDRDGPIATVTAPYSHPAVRC